MESRRTLWAGAAGAGLVVGSSPRRKLEEERFLWSPQDHETVPATPIHNLRCQDAREALERWLLERGHEGFVANDHNVYYDIDDLRRVIAPDVFVVLGVPDDRRRHNYRVWVSGVAPCFVMEFLSPSTRKRDLGEKKSIYAEMGVAEYFVFEGEEEVDEHGQRRGPRISPALQGFRLYTRDLGPPCYRRIPAQAGGLRSGVKVRVGYASEVLGLDVVCATSSDGASKDGDRVRFHDPTSNRFLLNMAEWRKAETRRADAAEHRADGEACRADAAEARIAELERQLAQRK